MKTMNQRRKMDRRRGRLTVAAGGVILALTVLAALDFLQRAEAQGSAEGPQGDWENWTWVSTYVCSETTGEDDVTVKHCDAESRWQRNEEEPDPDPEPEPDPGPCIGPCPEPEPEPEPIENIADVTDWSCFNSSICSGEPVDGTLVIRHGGGDKNSPGAGSDQPLKPGEAYRIRYTVKSCSADPCTHRLSTGLNQRVDFRGDMEVDEVVTADRARLNLSLQTRDKTGEIAITGLDITPAP